MRVVALAPIGARQALALTLALGCARRSPPPPPGHLPAVDAGPDARTGVHQAVVLNARILGARAERGPWRWSLTWGERNRAADSGALDGAGRVTRTHRYRAVGRYVARLAIRGRDASDTASDTLTVQVEPRGTPEVFVGAGDIGECGRPDASATARILDTLPGTVFTAGDNAYPDGTAADYAACYAPTWGRHRKRTHPVPGNHDYVNGDSAGYFGYFGVAAGDPGTGYYSFELGAWHVVAVNSNIAMRAGSAQEQWLRADLAAHHARCTLAYWHHPRFSSGTTHGSDAETQPLWQALYDAGADVVIAGHEHNYERFAPQAPEGTPDPARGVREFVAGTGGGAPYPFGRPLANSEVRIRAHGVLKLTLSDSSYRWEFIPVGGAGGAAATAADSGSASCHGGLGMRGSGR